MLGIYRALFSLYGSKMLSVENTLCELPGKNTVPAGFLTSSEYAAISAFGITEPGKEYEAIESGLIAFDGQKPINASGGLIGCGHPVGASGTRMLLDCYKQVTGQAGAYQVKGAKNAMMLNIGGVAPQLIMFL